MSLQPNLIVSISGRPKAGKTHLAMSFPDPIKIFSFDMGATFVRTKFPDKEIDIDEIVLPIIDSTEIAWAYPVWDKFEQDYKAATEGGKYKTIVIDTGTVVWQICHQAVIERKPKELAYVLPNLKMTSLFARAKVGGVNLVATHYLSPIYVKGENTGTFGLDGWKRTEGQVDIVLEIASKTMADKTVMQTTIKSNRFDRDLNGSVLDDTDYAEIMGLLGV